MTDFIALLRGINVGGHRKLRMADLRAICAALDLKNARTYLQSGNLRFSADADCDHAARLEAAICDSIGCDVRVALLLADDFAAMAATNPFIGQVGVDPAHLHLTVLISPTVVIPESLAPPVAGDEIVAYGSRCIYLHCPHGYGRTKLTNAWFERAIGDCVTTRNWRTVTAICDL